MVMRILETPTTNEKRRRQIFPNLSPDQIKEAKFRAKSFYVTNEENNKLIAIGKRKGLSQQDLLTLIARKLIAEEGG